LRGRLLAAIEAEAAEAGAERPERGGWLRRLGCGARAWRPAATLAALALALVAVAGYEVGSNTGDSGSGAGRAASTLTAGHSPGVTATMVRQGPGGELRLAHVSQLPGDEVLEAWVRREGRVEAVPALFVPNREGRAETTIDDMRGVDTVMVTAEPKGGSREPTSEPIVTLAIPQ
ncbi:MAG TPA: anti-sigma factor, partial [Solirubrobacterales bacterium]